MDRSDPVKTARTADAARAADASDGHARSREEIAALLRGHGITPTHQRMEIAQVLFARRVHLSADQILGMVNARHAESSKATVYNTLRLFVAKKLVRELIVDPARIVYDPNTAPHHHLYDVVSGQLTDIPAGDIRVLGLPQLPPGIQTEGMDIIVRTRPRDGVRIALTPIASPQDHALAPVQTSHGTRTPSAR